MPMAKKPEKAERLREPEVTEAPTNRTVVCEGRIGEPAPEFHGDNRVAVDSTDDARIVNNVAGHDFEWALLNLKCGNKVQRAGWNGKGMHLWHIPRWTYTDGVNDNYPCAPFIGMKTADGAMVPWLASQTDLLAYDWQLA